MRTWMSCLKVIVVLALFGVLCGCPKQSPTSTAKKDDGLFPFRPGAKWYYYMEGMMPNGERMQAQVFTNIDGLATVDGKSYVRVKSVSTGTSGDMTALMLYRQSSDGIYRLDDANREHGEFLDIPRPLNVGDEWDLNDPQCLMHCKVEAIEPVTIVSDTYNDCWKIIARGTFTQNRQEMQLERVIYRAPNIGEVRVVTTISGPVTEITYTQDLAKYE